ncbi:MAG: tetratricopeptide repeat protein [Thermodesulfovibrionales bacterium]
MKRFISFIVLSFLLCTVSDGLAQPEVDNCFNYRDAGDYQRAIAAGKMAVRLYPKNAAAYFCLGDSYVRIGEFNRSLDYIKQAERLATSKDDLRVIYNRLSLIYSKKGDLDNAFFYFSKELSLSRELGNKKGEAAALSNIGGIYWKKGELDKALQYYEESLKIQTDEKEKASTLNNIALIHSTKGDYEKAIKYLKDAIETGIRVGDYHGAAIRMLNLGNIYRETKDFSRAEEYLQEGLKRILKIGDKYWEATAYTYLGGLYRDKGDIQRARQYLTRAYELFNSIGAKANADDAMLSLKKLDVKK